MVVIVSYVLLFNILMLIFLMFLLNVGIVLWFGLVFGRESMDIVEFVE